LEKENRELRKNMILRDQKNTRKRKMKVQLRNLVWVSCCSNLPGCVIDALLSVGVW